MFQVRAATPQDIEDWQEELASWGMESPDDVIEKEYELWHEHVEVIGWWLDIPDFFRFNERVCLGMNVAAVKADADLSSRTINPTDYAKLKIIAKTAAEELNRELKQ
ncbi:hypothetical protein AL538_27285 [Vibrio harveyi]|uniref:Uncharacterized protein n=1 Tax=Vibrio harveyi TaxID=669 RepID=A0ABN4L6M8_VIBHA|nr:hypothetical protein AL538_27285 [Vibrio harveyi]